MSEYVHNSRDDIAYKLPEYVYSLQQYSTGTGTAVRGVVDRSRRPLERFGPVQYC